MNRMFFPIAVVSSGATFLLIDSTIKAALLLAVAGLVALTLRRDSAATRHLVWLVAIVAMLAVPVFAAMLPQWRVLPAWAVVVDQPAEGNGADGIHAKYESHETHTSHESHQSPTTALQPKVAGVTPRSSNAEIRDLIEKGVVRSYDFTNLSQVQELRMVPGSLSNVPEHLQQPLKEAAAFLNPPD